MPKLVKRRDMRNILENLPEYHETYDRQRITTWVTKLKKTNLLQYFDGNPDHAEELANITAEVNGLVKSLCRKIAKYDSRFKMTVLPTGSSGEGTKVGRPDEFDFALCLNEIDKMCNIVTSKQCVETGYACVKFKDLPVSDDFLPFSDMDGYFLAFPFLQYFFKYLQRALNEPSLWKQGNLYYNYEDKPNANEKKPVFSFNVYWVGSVYKQLKMSIDLVPAVYKPGWWPPLSRFEKIHSINDDIKAAGCFLILQTLNYSSSKKRYPLIDSICHTCNAIDDLETMMQKRMLRISAAPAEICLMKSLPEEFRRAYALGKILKGKEVCPEIEVVELPTKLYSRKLKFEQDNGARVPFKVSNIIKSYMLKNCIFYTYQEMQTSPGTRQPLNALEIAVKVFDQLLTYSDERYFNPFFLPYSDVFEFEKDEKKTGYKKVMFLLKRELSIKLILGILNHPFPEICLTTKVEA